MRTLLIPAGVYVCAALRGTGSLLIPAGVYVYAALRGTGSMLILAGVYVCAALRGTGSFWQAYTYAQLFEKPVQEFIEKLKTLEQ